MFQEVNFRKDGQESKRVIWVIADSLAAQRWDELSCKDRWPQILGSYLRDRFVLENRAKGASTTARLSKEDGFDRFGVVIIQLGIVDCAPRYLREWESRMIARFPSILRGKIIRLVTSVRSQSISRAYVPLREYEKNLESFIRRCSRPVLIIKILKPGKKHIKANPMVGDAVALYNRAIDVVASSHANVSVLEFPPERVDELTLADGYHLNAKGHEFLASYVLRKFFFVNFKV